MEDMDAVEYEGGVGSWLPTPMSIHREFIKLARAIVKHYKAKRSEAIWTKASFRRLIMKCKKWFAKNRHIHGVIVDRLGACNRLT